MCLHKPRSLGTFFCICSWVSILGWREATQRRNEGQQDIQSVSLVWGWKIYLNALTSLKFVDRQISAWSTTKFTLLHHCIWNGKESTRPSFACFSSPGSADGRHFKKGDEVTFGVFLGLWDCRCVLWCFIWCPCQTDDKDIIVSDVHVHCSIFAMHCGCCGWVLWPHSSINGASLVCWPKVCKFPRTTSSHRASEETRGQERLVPWEKTSPELLRLCGCWESTWKNTLF